jgi:hypothetical protein
MGCLLHVYYYICLRTNIVAILRIIFVPDVATNPCWYCVGTVAVVLVQVLEAYVPSPGMPYVEYT